MAFLYQRANRLKHAAELPTSNAVVEIESDGRQIACTGFPHPKDLVWIKAITRPLAAAGPSAPEVLSR